MRVEIRLRRMTREQGIALVQKYQTREPQHLQLFLEWLGITENAFYYIVDQHRNPSFGSAMRTGLEHAIEAYQALSDGGGTRHALDLVSTFTDFTITSQALVAMQRINISQSVRA